MTLEELETVVLAWGADPARWPADRRDAARAVMAEHPKAAEAILALTAPLDHLLRSAPAPTASARLRAAIIAAAPTKRREFDPLPWRGWFGAAAGAALAFSCAAGAVAGVVAVSHGLTPHGYERAPDPAVEAALLLRGPADMAEG